MTSHSLTTIILSLAALAFVGWLALAFPAQHTVYGPAPAAAII
jgi:hypothetical protein